MCQCLLGRFAFWLFPKFDHFSELTKENVIWGIFMKDGTRDLAINTIIIIIIILEQFSYIRIYS